MAPRVVAMAMAGGLIAGCAAVDQDERLSLTCEFSKCDCVSSTVIFLDTKPVEWQSDGRAACPEGYHLRKLSSP